MHTEDSVQPSDNKCGTIRSVRTVCKAFERRGNERSGYPLQFNIYLDKHGFISVVTDSMLFLQTVEGSTISINT